MSAEKAAVPAQEGPELKEGLHGGAGGTSGDPPSPPAAPQSVVTRVGSLPLVSCACGAVVSAYTSTKESHPYVRSVCDAAEKGVKTLTAAAVSGAQPLLTRLEPQISTANKFACKGLDKLEEKLPFLQQPPERVVARTRELVVSTVARMFSTVVGTPVGRLLVTGLDTVLGRSEELLERYLPGTAEEQVAPVGMEVSTGREVAPVEQQRRWQSYFVHMGSLSAKLRHRALWCPLGELQRAQHSAQQLLAQLHHLIQLIEEGQQGMAGPPQGTRERLHRMWLEWSQQEAVPMEESQVEARTLAMLRGLLHQLQGACARLASGARAFPGGVQETVGHVRHSVEGVQASLARARSFHDLSELVLAQSRDGVARARLGIDELLEHVGQHTPLPWLVGPFAPALVECPEDVPVEMAKWDGCVTVGGTRQAPTAPRVCSQH